METGTDPRLVVAVVGITTVATLAMVGLTVAEVWAAVYVTGNQSGQGVACLLALTVACGIVLKLMVSR